MIYFIYFSWLFPMIFRLNNNVRFISYKYILSIVIICLLNRDDECTCGKSMIGTWKLKINLNSY